MKKVIFVKEAASRGPIDLLLKICAGHENLMRLALYTSTLGYFKGIVPREKNVVFIKCFFRPKQRSANWFYTIPPQRGNIFQRHTR